MRLRGSTSVPPRLATAEPQQHCFPSLRAVFPLARKRRDSKHPPPSTQALCEESLKKPPCAAAHEGFALDGR
ncbi:hypothetical protein BO443_60001 [Burkholderia orbicola]